VRRIPPPAERALNLADGKPFIDGQIPTWKRNDACQIPQTAASLGYGKIHTFARRSLDRAAGAGGQAAA
jgi:hypothetical protein